MIKKRVNAKFIGNAILNSPVEYALQILGDKSTLLILKSIWLGKRKFEDFISGTGKYAGVSGFAKLHMDQIFTISEEQIQFSGYLKLPALNLQ